MSFSRWSWLLIVIAVSPAAHAQATFDIYRLTRLLGDEPPGTVTINDINEQGEMTGGTGGGTNRRGILLRDGMVIDLGDLMGGASRQTVPEAINDHTQITGWDVVLDASGNEVVRGFLWEAGQIRDLGIDPNAIPRDINNRGQIAGNIQLVDRGRPFFWDDGQTTFLELLPSSRPSGFAWAINESGVIVGHSTSAFGIRAVMWRDGEVMVLEPTLPHDTGGARDVNDRGDAIGVYTNQCGPVNQTAYVWREEGVTVLPPLDLPNADFETPLSINNHGQIVGRTSTAFDSVPHRATLWQEGEVVDLNALISDDDPLKPFVTLMQANRITDSGLIAAEGRDSREENTHHYLLTPTGASCTAASLPPSSSDTGSGASAVDLTPESPSSSDPGNGGGAVDLASLLLLLLALSAVGWLKGWRARQDSNLRPSA